MTCISTTKSQLRYPYKLVVVKSCKKSLVSFSWNWKFHQFHLGESSNALYNEMIRIKWPLDGQCYSSRHMYVILNVPNITNNNGLYFHVTIQKNNYNTLMSYNWLCRIWDIGIVQISRYTDWFYHNHHKKNKRKLIVIVII